MISGSSPDNWHSDDLSWQPGPSYHNDPWWLGRLLISSCPWPLPGLQFYLSPWCMTGFTSLPSLHCVIHLSHVSITYELTMMVPTTGTWVDIWCLSLLATWATGSQDNFYKIILCRQKVAKILVVVSNVTKILLHIFRVAFYFCSCLQ